VTDPFLATSSDVEVDIELNRELLDREKWLTLFITKGPPMAYYELQCEKCAHIFTVKQSFEEHDHKPQVKCPECGSTSVVQLYKAVHVITEKKS
jgi:putative FmdB family regulatory protein